MLNPYHKDIRPDAKSAAHIAEGFLLDLLKCVEAELAHEKEAITDGVSPDGAIFNLTGAAREYDQTKDAVKALKMIAESGFSRIGAYDLAALLNYSYTHTVNNPSPVFGFVQKYEIPLLQAAHLQIHKEEGKGHSASLRAEQWLAKNVKDYENRALIAGITVRGRRP